MADCASLPDVTFLLPDGGVLAVGQRAGGAVAHPSDVELIPTEVLSLRPAAGRRREKIRLSVFGWRVERLIAPSISVSQASAFTAAAFS